MKVFNVALISLLGFLSIVGVTECVPKEEVFARDPLNTVLQDDVTGYNSEEEKEEEEEDANQEVYLGEDEEEEGEEEEAEEDVNEEEDYEDVEKLEIDGEEYDEEGIAREGRQRNRAVRTCLSRTNNHTRGSCIGRRGCLKSGGKADGRCGPRGFVCCHMEKVCSQSTSQNNTIFLNAGYPSPDVGTGACSLTINRKNRNICQMRFDFYTLELSQPDSDGNCVTDFLTVTGGTSAAPIICGKNTRQHMYVDVDPEGGAVRLTVDRTAASMSDRMWMVKVSQIECTSKFRAPAGCLQFFTETSGTVNSFNFDQSIDELSIPQTTRQIVDMNYAVCVKMSDGYCSIMWTRNTTGGDFGFTVSSNIQGLSRTLIGDPASSSNSGVCSSDYVVIPGSVDDLGRKNDRFCGAGFPNHVTSNLRPFIMYVTTDSNEQDDVLNRGFSLDFRQMIC